MGKKEKVTKMAGEGSGSGGNRRFLTAVRRLIIKAQRKGKTTPQERRSWTQVLPWPRRYVVDLEEDGRSNWRLEWRHQFPKTALQTLGEEKRQRQSLDLEVGDLWTHWPHLAHLSTEGIGILLNATSACWCKPGKRLITLVFPVMPVDSFQGAPMA